MSGDVTFGNNGNGTVTLSILQVQVPMPQGQAAVPATGYYWTLPVGWKFASFGNTSTSDGSTPVLLNNPGAYNILVTPSGDTGGTATVRAADTSCGFNNPTSTVSSVSQPASTTVVRTLPTLSIGTDTPLPTPLACGDTRDFGFRADASNVPAGGFFSSYSWTASNNWGVPNPTAQRPGIRPSGSSGSTVTLSGTYTRNGFPTTVTASPRTFTHSNQASKPELDISGGFLLCYGESFQVTPKGNPGTEYHWGVDPATNISISPNPSLQGQTVTITAPAGGSYPAEGTVTVQVSAGGGTFNCGQSDPTPLRFVLYRARLNYVTNPIRLQVDSDPGYNYDPTADPDSGGGPIYQPVQCNRYTWLRLYGNLQDFYGNPLTNFRWLVDGQEPANSANQTTVLARLRGGQVCLVTTNRCGQDEYYCWQIPITGECGGGGGPIGDEPCVECRMAPTATAYPNPATAGLTVPLPAGAHGEVLLRNSQGRVLRRVPARGSQAVRLDVGALPEGLYLLEVPGPKGPTRQQVRVQH